MEWSGLLGRTGRINDKFDNDNDYYIKSKLIGRKFTVTGRTKVPNALRISIEGNKGKQSFSKTFLDMDTGGIENA